MDSDKKMQTRREGRVLGKASLVPEGEGAGCGVTGEWGADSSREKCQCKCSGAGGHGLEGTGRRPLWLQHQGKCKMSKAGSSRSLDCVLNAVGSHRRWVAVQQRKGCDCWVENGL